MGIRSNGKELAVTPIQGAQACSLPPSPRPAPHTVLNFHAVAHSHPTVGARGERAAAPASDPSLTGVVGLYLTRLFISRVESLYSVFTFLTIY